MADFSSLALFNYVICSLVPLRPPANLVPLHHLQADWLTPFDLAMHSHSERKMKRIAAAVARDKNTTPSFYMKNHNCFGACVTEEQQSIAAKGVVPVNTKVADDWALSNLQQWMDHHRSCAEEQVPDE